MGRSFLASRSNGRFRRFAPGCQHKHQPKPVLLIGDSSPPIRGSTPRRGTLPLWQILVLSPSR
jgi:hypothetical protein